jgi:hypothetical protein
MPSPIMFTLIMATAPTTAPAVPVKVAEPQPVCQAWGPKPPACIEPPLRERFRAFVSWRSDRASPQNPEVIRQASESSPYDSPLPQGSFPAFLRNTDAQSSAQVEMELVIGADGVLKSCRAVKVKATTLSDKGKFVELPADPGLGEKTCEIIRATRKFRSAINAEGTPVETTNAYDAHYSRERYEMLAPPAPPPPSRWIGRAPWGNDKTWPPNHTRYEAVSFAAPKFKDFLADKKALPKQALVGVLVDFAPDGRALKCEVGLPSADKRLDDATCAGLMATQNRPTRFQVRGLPMEVTWKGTKAKLVLAQKPVMPGLVAEVAIPPEQLPTSNVSGWPITVRVLIDPQGKPLSCTVQSPSYVDKLDAASCRLALQGGRYTPGINGFGRPALSGVDVRVDWKSGRLYWTGY